MFDEMADQFLARTTNTNTSTVSLPLSFSLHHHANFQPSFDASYLLNNPQFSLLHLQQHSKNVDKGENVSNNSVLPFGLLQEGNQRSSVMVPECVVQWSSEEVLALLKIISSLDNPWFPPEFTWENVSRKMAEFGFKRSAKNCKDKFEEETSNFNNSSNNNNKHNIISQNYRLFGELEELYNNNNANANGDGDDYDGEKNPHVSQLDDQDEEPESSLSRKNQVNCIDNENGDKVQEEVENVVGQEKSGNDETGSREDDIVGMEEEEDDDQQSVDDDSEKTEENTKKVVRKRKRQKKFEMFKGFCEKIVNKMIAQQEELHCKILQDMVKRDEEKFVRENAWRKQEIDRINHEMEIRAHEQAIVGDRQTKILGFLKKFSSLNNVECQSIGEDFGNVMMKVSNLNNSLVSTSSSIYSQDSISATQDQESIPTMLIKENCDLPISLSKENLAPQSPNRLESPNLTLPISLSSLPQTFKSPNLISPHQSFGSDHTSTNATAHVMDFKSSKSHEESRLKLGDVKDDTGRRWPRDEVLALINIRCRLFNNNGDQLDKENFSKGPLWERISQKMMELGYKRSAKRCKEKWENINKYFRKTKDLNKKRSIDSRTCPYFHQLSHLYNQSGPLHVQSDHPSTVIISPDNQSMPSSDAQGGFSTTVIGSHGNEGNVVQVSTGFGSVLNFD